MATALTAAEWEILFTHARKVAAHVPRSLDQADFEAFIGGSLMEHAPELVNPLFTSATVMHETYLRYQRHRGRLAWEAKNGKRQFAPPVSTGDVAAGLFTT